MKYYFTILCAASLFLNQAVWAESDTESLYLSYLRFVLAQQIPVQAADLAKTAGDEETQKQITQVASHWSQQQIAAIRAGLEQRFGASAKEKFQKFVSRYTLADHANDTAYLNELVSALGMSASDYPDLRGKVVDALLKDDVEAGSQFLGDVQTWLDLKNRKENDLPPLEMWLARRDAPASETAAEETKHNEVDDPLAEEEAGFDANVPANVADGNPLDSFGQMRKAKEDRKLEDAQAGMQQIAAERKAVEEEYASKKVAAAQAEAEAMKQHAETLAATEQQALDQRQNSWGNKLKNILGTAVGSAGGAFLGVLGTRAGEQTADEVFK